MFGTILAAVLLSGTATPSVPAPRGEDPDKRIKYLISRLDAKVGEIEAGDVALPFLLEALAKLAAEPDAEKNPELEFQIVVNEKAFKQVTQGMFDIERVQIKTAARRKDAPLSAVLKSVCDQLDGAYVFRRDHIEIIPLDLLRAELHINEDDETCFFPVVSWVGSDVSLDTALRDIARRFDANIVVAAAAKEKAKIVVSARLLNVPVDAAVRSLAETNGLKVIRMANVLLVTTKEHIREIETSPKKPEKKAEEALPIGIFPLLWPYRGQRFFFPEPRITSLE